MSNTMWAGSYLTKTFNAKQVYQQFGVRVKSEGDPNESVRIEESIRMSSMVFPVFAFTYILRIKQKFGEA